MAILGILAFVVALLFSVMVHEAGHYLTARKFGMKVTEFFLGFGQRIWSFRRGETEFGVKAIPAGGYCRIEGMTPQDEMPEGEEGRAFFKASSLRKLIVLGAGSFAHFCLGFLLIFSIFFAVGYTAITPVISQISPNSAAASSGFTAGDEIYSIDGKRVTNWSVDAQAINASRGSVMHFVVIRDGKRVNIEVTPTYNAQAKRYMLGVINALGTERDGFIKSITESSRATQVLVRESTKSLIAMPTKIPSLIRETFGDEKRDPNGLVGVVGAARVSGQTIESGKLTGTERFATFLLLIASLNIFVGLFNLLPILPLDGGHMAVAIVDEIRAFIARLRGRPRPQGIDVNVLTPVTMVVFALLAVLTVLLVIADIINPISLNL